MEEIRRAVTVVGRVQGVSFRYHTDQRANRLGLSGWVRNADDGTVHVEVQGEPAKVESLLRWLREGPRHAEVDDVLVSEMPLLPGEDGFRIVD